MIRIFLLICTNAKSSCIMRMETNFKKNKEYIAIAKTYHALRNEIKKSQDAPTKEDTYFKDLIKELSKKRIGDDCLTSKDIATLNHFPKSK